MKRPLKPKTAAELGHAIQKAMWDAEVCIRCGRSLEFIEDQQLTCGQAVQTKRRKKG